MPPDAPKNQGCGCSRAPREESARLCQTPSVRSSAMGLSVQWVRYGREAAQALRASIAAAKAGEPLAPVTVVVPSNHVGVAARRLLATGALGPVSGGIGLVAVTFVTPYRLAELLGA